MAEANKIKAIARTDFGKGASRRDRREGFVPVVLYGHGTEPRHLKLNTLDFAAILRSHGANSVLTLDIDGEEQLALTKQVDVEPIKRFIEHADLLVVKKGEKVEVNVYVTTVGEAAPGTLVTQDLAEITIEADALKIPEDFEIDIEGAEVGTQITAGDIKLPAGVSLVTDPELLIINVGEAPTQDDLEAELDQDVLADVDAEAEEAAETTEGGSESGGESSDEDKSEE